MPVERAPGGSSLIDVLDRILDKGIVIDAWVRISLVGIDLVTVEARVVVASIDFRMGGQHPYPSSLVDINYATRWLKAHAQEFASRRELVAGLGTSSGAHQLLLSALRPQDARYAALPLVEAPAEDARLPYIVLCWPIADPLARYRMVKEKGNTRLVEAHDAYWRSEAEMEEGNPQLILDRGEAATPLPQPPLTPAQLNRATATAMRRN